MNQKERERLFLTEIKELRPDLISGDFTDSESPDFILLQDVRKLGIEIVEYVRGQNTGESALRRAEVIRQHIIEGANVEFHKTRDEPLWVLFSWYPRKCPRKTDVAKLASAAVSAITNHIPHELFESVEVENKEFSKTPLKEFVRKIRVTKVRNEKQVLWSSIASGWISVEFDEIQGIISSKNLKVKHYKEKCQNVWLVIVADGRHVSSNVGLENITSRNQYSSEFDKVIFYDRFTQNIIELAV